MTSSSHGVLPGPGWYPDPYRYAELRWWDGAQWSEKASTGDALGHSHVQYPMPPPAALPAPTLIPGPRRRRKGWLLGVAVIVLLIVLAVATRTTKSGQVSLGGGVGLDTETTAAIDPLEADCIANSLEADDRLRETATTASDSFSRTSWDGNEAFLEYGRNLSLVDLSNCPDAYSVEFQRYVRARTAYGEWINEHTGLSHALAGSDRSGMSRLQDEIVAANDEMMTVVDQYRPDLSRRITFSN